MFVLHKPSRREVLTIQAAERAYYWSGAAEGVLRKHGLVGAGEAGGRARGFSIVTRRTRHRPGSEAACFEGPLASDVASALGITVRARTAESLTLTTATGRPLGHLSYPRFTVRRIPRERGERSDPYPHVSDDPYWNNRRIALQELTADDAWRTIAFAQLNGSGAQVPVALSDRRRLVFGVPLLDLIGYGHAVAPLDVGFFELEDESDPFAAERWLVEQLIEHAVEAGHAVLRIADWPLGFTAALTVRHDYDRTIGDDAVDELLRFYEDRGVRSSWGFLVANGGAAQARRLIESGHEVLLHTAAGSRRAFVAEMRALRRSIGRRVGGYTAHGGLGAAGHLGQTQFDWAERCGMLYGEILQKETHLPSRAVAVRRGVPRLTGLMLPTFHAGLDESTKPEGHLLDDLCKAVPIRLAGGDHVVVMNHPDIHVPQLEALLGSLNLSAVWAATLDEIMTWADVAKFRSRVSSRPDSLEIDFGGALPADTIAILHGPRGDERESVARAGSTRMAIHLP